MRRPLALAAAVLVLAGASAASAHAASPTAPLRAPTLIALRGIFMDSAKYTGSGSAAVTRRGRARTLRLGRDFRADPESIRLRLYLATSPSGRTFVDLGPMAEVGAQSFRVPAGVDLGRYRWVIAWCAAVDEPITQARLRPIRR